MRILRGSNLLEPPAEEGRRLEIDAALNAAFDETTAFSRQALRVTREEIDAVLEAVFPQRLCTMPAPRKVELLVDHDLFEISYDREMNCLMNEGLIDRQWVPAGKLWFSDRPETS